MDIIVRCELDGVVNFKGEDQLVSIKALNEIDMRAQVRACACVGRLRWRAGVLMAVGVRVARLRRHACIVAVMPRPHGQCLAPIHHGSFASMVATQGGLMWSWPISPVGFVQHAGCSLVCLWSQSSCVHAFT